jgi:SAF domain
MMADMTLPDNTDGSASSLDNLQIAAPCHVSWDGMTGDERVRLCQSCKLNVYNISEMSKKEAEELINKSEGRLCVRFYKRKDGTILTNNCPVGLRAVQRRLYAKIAGLVALFSGTFIGLYLVGIINRAQNHGEVLQGEVRVHLDAKMDAKGKIVYVVQNIPKGNIIPATALEEREILQSKIPYDAIVANSLAVGKVAKYGIAAGQILSVRDIQPTKTTGSQSR